MKRLLFTALLWTVALHAQGRMGAVHSSFPTPARSAGGAFHGGTFRPAPVSRPAPVARPAFSRMPAASFAPRSFNRMAAPVHSRVFVNTGFRQGHHARRFRPARRFHPARRVFFNSLNNNCFGAFSLNSPFCNNVIYPYYSYPIFPYDYPAQQYTQPPVAYPADDSQTRALSLEIERLSEEIDSLREQQERHENQTAAPEDQAATRPSRPPGLSSPPYTLILRDGRQMLAENYAVSGGTIWILDQNKVKKIPLSEIDTAATQRANADTDFRLRQ